MQMCLKKFVCESTAHTAGTEGQWQVCSCVSVHQFVSLSQLKQLEIERAEKWLKMVKKWDKYKNSDRVSNSPHIPERVRWRLKTHFIYFLIYFYLKMTSLLGSSDNYGQVCEVGAGFCVVSESCNG